MKFKTVLVVTALFAAASAEAKIFTVKWSGAQFGNSATATGTFDINTALYPTLGGSQPNIAVGPDFKVLGVKVTGASSGNGSFTQSNFNSAYFAAFSPLNYNKELIGQPLSNGFTYGSFGAGYGGPSGDFNLFGSTSGAPNGTFYFQLQTSNGSGDRLAVTSIAPGVPEPASWALMVAGFGLVGAAARRRKAALAV